MALRGCTKTITPQERGRGSANVKEYLNEEVSPLKMKSRGVKVNEILHNSGMFWNHFFHYICI